MRVSTKFDLHYLPTRSCRVNTRLADRFHSEHRYLLRCLAWPRCRCIQLCVMVGGRSNILRWQDALKFCGLGSASAIRAAPTSSLRASRRSGKPSFETTKVTPYKEVR